MAPKGAKRAAAASKEEPEAKRLAAHLKQHGVTKSAHEAIREIMRHPLAGLPADARDMLLAMLPWSLCIPSDQRIDAHNKVVKMVKEVAAGIQKTMQEAVQAEGLSVGSLDEKKAELQGGIQSAEAALAAAKATAEERKRELAEASAALLQQKRALGEAECKAKKDTDDLEKAQAQRQEVEGTMMGSFQKFKSGEWQLGEEDSLYQPVHALIAKLSLDESLVTSLPVSLKKKERGAFNQVVVANFEESLSNKVGELDATISNIESAVAVNASDVEEAKAAFDGAQAKQKEIASEFGAAQEDSTKVAAKVKEAEGTLAAFEPEYEKATAVRKAKADELEAFESYHMCLLKTMVEKLSKKKEAELAQAAAAVEQQKMEAAQSAMVTESKEEASAAQASVDATQLTAAEAGA